MKSISSKALALCALFGCAASAYAIPTLQVGVLQTNPVTGNVYVNYTTQNPDQDTAFTSGTSLVVGGAYSNGKNQEALIGGQYSGGLSWAVALGDMSKYAVFNTLNGGTGAGAVLVASVLEGAVNPDGTFSDPTDFLKISLDGGVSYINPFFASKNSLLPNPPANHYPAQDGVSDFLYFDIGDFAKITNAVPNFDESDASDTGKTALGEIKNLLISTSGFQWIHFDVMALATTEVKGTGQDKDKVVGLLTTLTGNPGSHDASWQDPGGPPFGTPEPATPLLLGLGLLGLLMARRARSK